MFNTVKIAIPVLALGASFFLGYSFATDKCTIKQDKAQIAQEQAIVDSLQSSVYVNQKIANEVYDVSKDLYISLSDIDNEFSLIHSTPIISDDFGLSINTTSKSGSSMSGTTKTSDRVSEDGYRQLKDNSEKFQRLYEAELIKAKKCDVAIAKLNNLIDFYSKVYTTYNE